MRLLATMRAFAAIWRRYRIGRRVLKHKGIYDLARGENNATRRTD